MILIIDHYRLVVVAALLYNVKKEEEMKRLTYEWFTIRPKSRL